MNKRKQRINLALICSLLLAFVGLSGCGLGGGQEEWAGEVSVWMSMGGMLSGNPSSITVLEVADDERYVLQVPQDVEVEGVEKVDMGIVWKLGKRYRITGKLVTDQKTREEMNVPGKFIGAIIVSEIKLLDEQ